jgi:hypothetical protein
MQKTKGSKATVLMPVILTTWEAGSGGSQFQDSMVNKACDSPFQWTKTGQGGACLSPSEGEKCKIGGWWSRPVKCETLSPK